MTSENFKPTDQFAPDAWKDMSPMGLGLRDSRYGNQKKFSLYKLEQQVGWIIQTATIKTFPGCKLTFPWKDFCVNLVKLQPVPQFMVVCLQKPEFEFLKLNTDGSFNKDNGRAGLGGALRDKKKTIDHGLFHPIPLHQPQHCRSKGSLGVRMNLVHHYGSSTNALAKIQAQEAYILIT
ncbi:hypothetical protein MTR67_053101 [Solanum verrucosum]|uniref:RNase H type-1 domain-containing protein n=1 Tax=Solanum verrucosum TaxID=315347 RepID=A0AAF1A1M7_SOLVR|nr:hypothetical protein MTR67_053101 [Solanum verrucosum]